MKIELEIKKFNLKTIVDRNDIQAMGVEVSKHFNAIFFKFCTRLGKSKLIMDIVNHHNYKKVLFVCAQNIHIKTFTEDCVKFNNDVSVYTLICWNSLKKYNNEEWDLIVHDEADVSVETRIKYLENCTYKKVVLISATMEKPQEDLYNSKLNFFKWEISLNKAITWNILPKPIIYLKRLIPDKKEQLELDNINKKIKSFYDKGNVFMSKKTGLERKSIYNKIKLKWFFEENIFDRLKDKRTLFFLPNIKESEKLGNSVSSLESNKKNNELLEKFNNLEISYIISNKILIRGVSMYDIKFALILALDLKRGVLDQKFGRILLDKASSVILPFVANSKEEKLIEDFVKSLPCEIKWMN